jgi:predicted secreted protein
VLQKKSTMPGAFCTALAAVLLAGCGQPQEPAAPAAPGPAAEAEPQRMTPEQSRAAPTLTLTDADADRALAVQRGQVVEVRLPSDRAAGFAWIPAENVLPVMSTDGVPEFESEEGAPGNASGTEVWRFIGREQGHAHLVFEYRRLTEPEAPPHRTIVYHFDVE